MWDIEPVPENKETKNVQHMNIPVKGSFAVKMFYEVIKDKVRKEDKERVEETMKERVEEMEK